MGWGWGWGDGWNSAKLRRFCEDAEVLKKVVWKSRSGLDWVEVEASVAISVWISSAGISVSVDK